MSQISHQGRQDRQQHTEVGDQAEKPADYSQKIKVGQANDSEKQNAEGAEKYSDDEVAQDERTNHPGNQAQHDVGRVSVFHAEQHHGSRAHVVLPTQHEENEERDEGQGQHQFRNRIG